MKTELGLKIKNEFEIFKNNPDIVYLDNAATTQKPKTVIGKLIEVYTQYNSNVHRGLYSIAQKVDSEFEKARSKIASFINADIKEIIFTSGATESINDIVTSLVTSNILENQINVLTTELDHHSSFVPWQNITGASLEFATINDEGDLEFNTSIQYHVVTIPLVSNVTGELFNVKSLKKLNCLKDAIFIIDASQAVAHTKIDVKEIDAEFLVFSGHKMFGPTGIGVLFGKYKLLEKLNPFKFGGGMVNLVTKKSSDFKEIPYKFEAGTPAIAEAIALGASVEFINSIGIEQIEEYENELRDYFLDKISNIKEVRLFHNIKSKSSKSVFSFTINGIHPHDVAQFLADNNICVRAGNHCVQIYHKSTLNIPASVRVSLSIYNTKEDIDKLMDCLMDCVKYYA